MSSDRPFVSVIIPVYNDFDRLKLCLSALENQTYPADRYEVLVVDNGSKDDVSPVISNYAHVRSLKEEKTGSYSARNRGITEARGEIFSFTDSDCLPALNWLSEGVNALIAAADCGLIAGRIDVFWRPNQTPTAVELYDAVRGLHQKSYVNAHGFGATANVFTWRKVMDAVGPFDTELRSCGDMEWGQRVGGKGYRIVYCDAAVVAHPARTSFGELGGKMRRVAGGLATLKKKSRIAKGNGSAAGAGLQALNDILRDARVKRHRDKAKVLGVAMYVELVKIAERIRLMLGGEPLR